MASTKAVYNNDVKFNNGIVEPVRIVTGNTSLTNTSGPTGAQTSAGNDGGYDQVLGVNVSSIAININLPESVNNGRTSGRIYTICDHTGNASTNNITIDAGVNGTINGNQTHVISSNYNSVQIKYITDETVGEATFYRWMIV